jgi:UDP-GlcNAc:undecaprenyl-phosphate GlcNAc-1-phosphate transferase
LEADINHNRFAYGWKKMVENKDVTATVMETADNVPWVLRIRRVAIYIVPLIIATVYAWGSIKITNWARISLIAFIVTFLFMPVASWLARRFKIMDIPDARRIHKRPTPRLGGLAIYIGFAAAVICNYHFDLRLKGLAVGSTIIFLVSLWDDWKGLPAKFKLFMQMVASVVVIVCGVRLNIIPNTWPGDIYIEGVLTVLWMVSITNAVNFMDGSDGVVGGLSIFSLLSFFLIAVNTQQYYLAFLCISIAWAAAAFLCYNVSPAKIFLGDGGSCFFGFMLAGMAVMGDWATDHPMVSFSVPLVILGIPIFDMCFTTLKRVVDGKVHSFGEWLAYVGKDHLHHRILAHGFNARGTALLLATLNLIMGLGAVGMQTATNLDHKMPVSNDSFISVIMLSQGVLVFVVITILLDVKAPQPKEENGGDNSVS